MRVLNVGDESFSAFLAGQANRVGISLWMVVARLSIHHEPKTLRWLSKSNSNACRQYRQLFTRLSKTIRHKIHKQCLLGNVAVGFLLHQEREGERTVCYDSKYKNVYSLLRRSIRTQNQKPFIAQHTYMIRLFAAWSLASCSLLPVCTRS